MRLHKVCPVWLGYLLACPLRRLIYKPEKVLAPYVAEGMTALEVGPGMGFFTLPMARMVGSSGRVLCVDIQEGMLSRLSNRAAKAGLAERVATRTCPPDSLGVDDFAGRVNFALLFYVVHEVPDAARLFADVKRTLKPSGRCLFVEPKGHVSAQDWDASLAAARAAGFTVADAPPVHRSYSAILTTK